MGKRGRLFRSKRAVATELLLEAMQAIAVILILASSLAYVQNELARIGFAKKFYARDMALLTTTLYSAPGNIYYMYYVKDDEKDPGKYKYTFNISNNFAVVNATNSAKTNSYWYFSSAWMKPILYSEKERLGLINFAKEANEIKAGLSIKTNPKKVFCPAVNTKVSGWKTAVNLIIDPAHGENSSDLGGVNIGDNGFYEEERVLLLALSSGFQMETGKKRFLTRDKSTAGRYKSLDKRSKFIREKAGENSIVIGLSIGDYPDKTKNYIKAYYNINSGGETKTKSRKLGCKILNSILVYQKLKNTKTISGVAIIASDSDYVQKVLPSENVGVVLELGNIQIQRGKNFLADTTNLARAIYEGIEDYYENE